MPDPADLRAALAEYERQLDAARREVLILEDLVASLRRAVELREGGEVLPPGSQSGKKDHMVTAARARISQGRKKIRGKSADFVAAASPRGYTIRSAAEQLRKEDFRVSHVIISRALSGKGPIRRAVARRIEELIGYRATEANWPGGWAGE